jgi:hypothetical protein
MVFPGAGAQVYRNEAGEPIGWDYPSYDEPDVGDIYDAWDEGYYDADDFDCEFCGGDCDGTCPEAVEAGAYGGIAEDAALESSLFGDC